MIIAQAQQKASQIVDEASKRTVDDAQITSEAQQTARQTLDEAKKKAEDDASSIVADASETARQIIDEARHNADDHVLKLAAEAEQSANQIIDEARNEARNQAMTIVTEAEQRASQIIEGAEKQAEGGRQIVPEAEQTASQILDEVKRRARDNARVVKQEAARLLTTANKKRIREDDVQEVFERIHRNLLYLVAGLERPPATPMKKKSTVPEPPETEAAKEARTEAATEGPWEQRLPGQDEEADLDVFHGYVELALPPPIGLDQMLQIHKTMKESPYLNVLNLGGSVDSGITIRVFVEAPIPLLKVIGEMPEVVEASEELPGDEKLVPGRRGEEEYPLRRIIITTKR